MVAHRLRRWASISPTLGQCLVFAGRCIRQEVADIGLYRVLFTYSLCGLCRRTCNLVMGKAPPHVHCPYQTRFHVHYVYNSRKINHNYPRRWINVGYWLSQHWSTSCVCWVLNIVPKSHQINAMSTCTIVQEFVPSKHGHVNPMPIYCWADVSDVGPTLNRHWVNVSCLLGNWGLHTVSAQYQCRWVPEHDRFYRDMIKIGFLFNITHVLFQPHWSGRDWFCWENAPGTQSLARYTQ